MIEIEFEAPRGSRILRSRFSGITTFHSDPTAPFLWWDGKQWVDQPVSGSSNFSGCNSYKAFLRHLKKHQEKLKTYEVVLVSRYIGYNVTATFKEDN
jgi:hypothetical protein